MMTRGRGKVLLARGLSIGGIGPLSALSVSIRFGASLTIGNNAAPGALIAHASVSGQGLSHTFTLISDAGGQFSISSAGALSVAGPLTEGSNTITVRADNGVDAPIEQNFSVVVEAVTLTTTTMQMSVTDPTTGHEYFFVAADGVTPEARRVGQYQDGTYFAVSEAGNPVRIGSILPLAELVSTEGYSRPDNLNDTAATGVRMRATNGAMLNPWQGVLPGATAPMGFDSFYGDGQPANSIQYSHTVNVDPAMTGVPIELYEGSVVKAKSIDGEGGHSAFEYDKSKIDGMSFFTVTDEVPAAGSFRPSVRSVSKRARWKLDDLDIEGHRDIVSGMRPYEEPQLSLALGRINYAQQTFAPFQEQARRWCPGAHGAGCDIYGDKWYEQFARCFATFDGDYLTSEIEALVIAVVQVGLDIFGLLEDGGEFKPWQAHHAGRQGVCFMAGLLLGDQDILDQCDWNLHPYHFGVDSAYCGYVTQDMIGVQPRFYKKRWQVKFEQEHLGLAEWSEPFANPDTTVANSQQVASPDNWYRDYNVLSFDNGAMWQCLWGMKHDPTARYYNPAYFDYADRYNAARQGDQIHGDYNISGSAESTQGVVTGNWWSKNPSAATVQLIKQYRDSIPRPNYVLQMRSEYLPGPQVSYTPGDPHLVVNLHANNVQVPRHEVVPILDYDLRWTAYAGTAETATGEDDPNWIGNFEWRVIEGISSFPFNLTDAPDDVRVKVQVRSNNANGKGLWIDTRQLESYTDNNVFAPLNHNSNADTNYVVPADAALAKSPISFGFPRIVEGALVVGGTVTCDDGVWHDGVGSITTERVWRLSSDGGVTWQVDPTRTGVTFTATAADAGKILQPGVRKTNDAGTSDYVFALAGLTVAQPAAIVVSAGTAANSAYDTGVALGGKRLLIMAGAFQNNPIVEGLSIGAHSFPNALATNTNSGTGGGNRIRMLAHIADVPAGETATSISFTTPHINGAVGVYELTVPMELDDADESVASGVSLDVSTTDGGAAFWFGRGGNLAFVSSDVLVTHAVYQDFGVMFAHALGVSDGTANVLSERDFDSNTRAMLLSLKPVVS